MLFNWCALFEVWCFGGPSVKHQCQISSVLSWIYSEEAGQVEFIVIVYKVEFIVIVIVTVFRRHRTVGIL